MAFALPAPAPTFKFFRIPFYKPAPAHIPAPAHKAPAHNAPAHTTPAHTTPAQWFAANTRPGSKLTTAQKLTLVTRYCREVPLEEIPEANKINCAYLFTKLSQLGFTKLSQLGK